MRTLIKDGFIVDGSGRAGFAGDVVMDGDRIDDVVESGLPQSARSGFDCAVDASGCMVTPGFKPIFEDILREGQLAGEIRDDVPADLIAEMFHSVYQAAAFSKLPVGFQENVALKTRLLLAGIRKA